MKELAAIDETNGERERRSRFQVRGDIGMACFADKDKYEKDMS